MITINGVITSLAYSLEIWVVPINWFISGKVLYVCTHLETSTAKTEKCDAETLHS